MGTFSVAIEIGDPAGRRWERADALVDTGASFTLLPRGLLERLGVPPIDSAMFDLADGRSLRCDLGQTQIRIDGRSRMTLIVFGPPDAEPLLGAYTLEAFLLAPDPVNRRLVSVRGLLKRA